MQPFPFVDFFFSLGKIPRAGVTGLILYNKRPLSPEAVINQERFKIPVPTIHPSTVQSSGLPHTTTSGGKQFDRI